MPHRPFVRWSLTTLSIMMAALLPMTFVLAIYLESWFWTIVTTGIVLFFFVEKWFERH